MKSLVTGASGFIGLNLCNALIENGLDFITLSRSIDEEELSSKLLEVDFVFHLAGVNKPDKVSDGFLDNEIITRKLANALVSVKSQATVIFASSIQAVEDNEYGKSKLNAEKILIDLNRFNGNPVVILRFGNLFGRWSRPYHNSVIATFCHDIISENSLKIFDPERVLGLTHIDSVTRALLALLEKKLASKAILQTVESQHGLSVSKIAETITGFKDDKLKRPSEFNAGSLERELFETYVSFKKPEVYNRKLASKTSVQDFLTHNSLMVDKPHLSFLTVQPGGVCLGKDLGITRAEFILLQGNAFLRIFGNCAYSNNGFLRLDLNSDSIIISSVNTLEIRNPGMDELILLFWENQTKNNV